MAEKKQYIPPEIQKLFELGKAGKLWTIEVAYNLDQVTKKYTRRNLTDVELMKFRDKMFQFGMTQPIEPGHWKVVCPMDIISVDLWKQAAYFPDEKPPGFPT